MSISLNLDDRWDNRHDGARQFHFHDNAASVLASLIVNAAFILAMILETNAHLETQSVREIAVEVVSEPPQRQPPETAKPQQQVVKPEAKAEATSGQRKSAASGLPNVADEERKLKAQQGEKTIEGDGTDKMESGRPSESNDEQNSAKLDPDPNKEISHIIPPAAPSPTTQAKPRIVPLGPDKKLTAQTEKPDPTATDNETAIKRKPIECGANATVVFHSPKVMRGEVMRLLSQDEAMNAMQMNQSRYDMRINPNYIHNVRVAVQVGNAQQRPLLLALLPPGMSAQVGDHVEFLTGHPDQSMPCHYIPNLVSRVL